MITLRGVVEGTSQALRAVLELCLASVPTWSVFAFSKERVQHLEGLTALIRVVVAWSRLLSLDRI